MSVFISISLVLIALGLQFAFTEEDAEEGNVVNELIRLAEEAKKHDTGDFVSPANEGETFDVGEFSVFVPEGWMAIPVMNAFGDSLNTAKTNSIRLCKGAVSPFDIMTKPSLEIIFYGKTQGIMPPKLAYKDVVDVVPFTTGDHTWGGFRASAFRGKKLIVLWEDTGAVQYQVNMWIEGEDSSISLDDEDVVKILGSIAPSITL